MKTGEATAEVFFTAFRSLKAEVREAFLERIINDRALREDLIDIALIEKAKKVKGSATSAKEYFAKRRQQETHA
jgi:hypothetical protein